MYSEEFVTQLYHSHLPVLKAALDVFNIKSVFEFGSGLGSTPLFIKECESVHSIEMQSEEWFEKVSGELSGNDNFTYQMMLGPQDSIDYFLDSEKTYDMVFADGHPDSRPECVNAAITKSDIVITHDTHTNEYGWDRVVLPESWSELIYKGFPPWTTVFYNADNVNPSRLINSLPMRTKWH